MVDSASITLDNQLHVEIGEIFLLYSMSYCRYKNATKLVQPFSMNSLERITPSLYLFKSGVHFHSNTNVRKRSNLRTCEDIALPPLQLTHNYCPLSNLSHISFCTKIPRATLSQGFRGPQWTFEIAEIAQT